MISSESTAILLAACSNPTLLDLWKGTVDLGFTQSTGNSVTSTISSSASILTANSNRYIANPVPGRKTNDLWITTGFRILFAK